MSRDRQAWRAGYDAACAAMAWSGSVTTRPGGADVAQWGPGFVAGWDAAIRDSYDW